MSRYVGTTTAPATATGAATTASKTSAGRTTNAAMPGTARRSSGSSMTAAPPARSATSQSISPVVWLEAWQGVGEWSAWSVLYECAGTGSVPTWTGAGRASERRSAPQTSAPTAKIAAAHQNAVV